MSTTPTLDQPLLVQGAIGVPIVSTIIDPDTNAAADISSATTLEYYVRTPSSAVVTWTAAFVTDGTDGQITYTTSSGYIDESGTWVMEARIVTATQDYRTVTQPQFRVRGTIS